MRKVFFFFTVLFCVTMLTFGQQMSNQEIVNTIAMSKEYNHQVVDPNLIYPGEILTFAFQDRTIISAVVESGDSQWSIIKDRLAKLVNEHGPVINYPDTIQPQLQLPVNSTPAEKDFLAFLSVIPWWVCLIAVLLILWAIVSEVKDKRNIDPVTAGTPQVPGGVTDQRVYQRMSDLAAQRYPGARIEIKNIRRGWLSGSGKVFYAEGKPKKINLKNVAAYAGEILVNGNEQTIYFLQGCGNDARMGNYMFGNEFVFTPDVIVNSDGSESPLPVTKTEKPNQQSQVTPVSPNLGSEFFRNSTSALGIVGKFLEGNDAKHKVTIKVTHDSVEAIIENRFDQKQAAKSAEKKEEQK